MEPGPNTHDQDALEALKVIQRLEIGPVTLEKQRLKTPYRITNNGRTDTLDLIYKFEEDVFSPGEPASRNLADMIASQVAINYGLFCERIVFRGTYDHIDRRFIDRMARNTAREIWVNKFLQPNHFLRQDVIGMPPARRKNYLAARLIFEPSEANVRETERVAGWQPNRARHAVLSSGGKDSLLSYALLNENGAETHPLFVNESGRHWFTALNAYRHFSENIPNTARVWTNADRLFAWMLRHLPFVRQDFDRVRSDEYPIRLWTVAVFLFGVLPLMKKRGIGRLVIGDEYDTTQERTYRGIRHYDGLYDQSRFFDHALTRYFHAKGWGIAQFSLLRPMSELLIEKLLAERYPPVSVASDLLPCGP